jgi:hypothetical protein
MKPWTLSIALLLLPSAAAAQDATARPWAARDAFELSVSAIMFRPKLGNVKFDHDDFHHRGRELGLDTPSMWGADLGLHVRHKWIAIGFVAFLGGHPGDGDATPDPPNNEAAHIANTGSIVTFGGAADLAAAIPAGRYVSLRFGPLVGLRAFVLPLSNAPKEQCSDESDKPPECTPSATSDVQPFLEPRVRALVSLDHTGLFFGASLGYEVFGGGLATSLLFGGIADL